MRALRIDANQPAIIEALQALGCSVDALPGGNGRPDLSVGVGSIVCGSHNLLIEIKDGSLPPSHRQLNSLQRSFHRAWKGRIHLVNSIAEVISVIGHVRKLPGI